MQIFNNKLVKTSKLMGLNSICIFVCNTYLALKRVRNKEDKETQRTNKKSSDSTRKSSQSFPYVDEKRSSIQSLSIGPAPSSGAKLIGNTIYSRFKSGLLTYHQNSIHL